MKIPVINQIKSNTKIVNRVSKQLKSVDLKPIKTYAQYLKEYGLK